MSNPIKVAYVLDSLGRGGAEGQVMQLIRRLDREAFVTMLVVLDPNGGGPVEGQVQHFSAVGLPAGGNLAWKGRIWELFRAARRLRRTLRDWRPDVVHAFLPTSCILGTVAGRLAGAPVVIASRRSLASAYRGPHGLAAAADRLSLRLAHLALGNSQAVTQDMVTDGCPANKTFTIHNGVDTQRFHPALDRALRTQLGWTQENVVLGMVANFSPLKRHLDFLACAQLLRPRCPQLRLLMAGSDRGTLPEVHRLMESSGLSAIAHIAEDEPRPETILGATDIYVSSSDTEGFSNAILEAMASGKPVVATDVGGTGELVVQGETGLLVPSRDPEALARSIERLICDRALRQAMGTAARNRAVADLSTDRMVRAYQDLYIRLLEAHGQGAD